MEQQHYNKQEGIRGSYSKSGDGKKDRAMERMSDASLGWMRTLFADSDHDRLIHCSPLRLIAIKNGEFIRCIICHQKAPLTLTTR